MIAISMFGALFTWLMIFVTHLFFRRKHPGSVRVPDVGLSVHERAGRGTDARDPDHLVFTREFRMTLIYGLPFLAVLSTTYYLWYLRRS